MNHELEMVKLKMDTSCYLWHLFCSFFAFVDALGGCGNMLCMWYLFRQTMHGIQSAVTLTQLDSFASCDLAVIRCPRPKH